MTRVRQLFAVARACFRPASPQTLAGVSAYVAYLVWLAMRGIGSVGDTAYIHLSVALAAAGAWVGGCVARGARWPGASFTPSFTTALGIVAAFVTVSAVGINGAATFVGGLDLWTFTAFAPLAAAAGLSAGYARPSFGDGPPFVTPHPRPTWSALRRRRGATDARRGDLDSWQPLLVSALALLAWFVFRLRAHTITSLSPSWSMWRAKAKLPPNRLWEPSMPQRRCYGPAYWRPPAPSPTGTRDSNGETVP